jgi:hypothetical protein
MSKTRDAHKQALRVVFDRYCIVRGDREKLIDDIIKASEGFYRNPSLDEALNSGNGTYKP